MALRYFYRGNWRVVSAAKARILRRRGYQVLDTAAPVPVVVLESGEVIAESALLERMNREADAVESAVRSLRPAKVADLTDDELERLTKPDGD